MTSETPWTGDYFSAPDWQEIGTAPRDGTVIEVGDRDAGAFPMRWSASQTNGLFPGATGFWVTPGDDMTWSEHDGYGPTLWRPLGSPNSHVKVRAH